MKGVINLRGTAADKMQDSDGLVSIRVWVEGQRVTSVSRHRLGALPKVEAAMLAGRLDDGGDFVAALAQAISKAAAKATGASADNMAKRAGYAMKATHTLQFANQTTQSVGIPLARAVRVLLICHKNKAICTPDRRALHAPQCQG